MTCPLFIACKEVISLQLSSIFDLFVKKRTDFYCETPFGHDIMTI